nr:hypothetical protein [Ignavibacteriaceae bacterium]
MKKVLGLDIGTNSIGWAVIENDIEKQDGKIIKLGSRIIPMEGREKDFEAGLSVSKNADRRLSRGARRLLQRYRLRRTRLINVLRILEWLPNNFPTDFKQIQKFNINEYLPFESNTIDEANKLFNVTNISSDWLIYYVRTKALTHKISLTELARLLYHFNQRRGFKSSRKDIKEVEASDQVKYPIKEKYIDFLTILKIIDTKENTKYGKIFSVIAKNNLNEEVTAKIIRKSIPDWEGKVIEIEVTKTTTKNGDVTYEFRLPDRTDWEKMKLALEQELVNSKQHPGEYHFHNLLVDRNYRIKDRIIDRKFYKDELLAILETQAIYYPFLKEKNVKPEVIDSLYKHNSQKRKELTSNDLIHLFINDIIYFQRPLKSQKHLIAECQYEKKADPNGNLFGVKVSAKSSPIFQEFRIWQDIHNLKIFKVY